MIAYCYRSGEIDFGQRVPSGALLVLSGRGRIVREVVSGGCRLAYDGRTLLVPGVPEAPTDGAALAAAGAFRDRMAENYARAVASREAVR